MLQAALVGGAGESRDRIFCYSACALRELGGGATLRGAQVARWACAHGF